MRAQVAISAYQQAISYVQQGKPGDAIPILERMLADSPADLRARNLIGIALSAAGRRAEANKHFQRALAADPKFYPALKNMALNELALGLTADARSHFEQALAIAPGDLASHLGLADIEYRSGSFAAAIAHYGQSGDLYFKDPHALVSYARACLETKQPEKARLAMAAFPAAAEPGIHFEAGLLLARLEDYPAAAQQFRLANGAPDRYQAGFNLAAPIEGRVGPESATVRREIAEARGRSKSTTRLDGPG